MPFLDFTEMPVWQKANFVVERSYAICFNLPKSEDYALSSQLKRAALSITANIAEAFGRNHSKDKINFYFYARGSAFEVRSHLIVGRNLKFFKQEDITEIEITCKDIIEAINKIIKGLNSKNS
jgi:four helix bundle protein